MYSSQYFPEISTTLVTAPMHMKGAERIGEVFGVSRATVVRWVKEGAPIYLVGKRYQSSYAELWNWIGVAYAKNKPKNGKCEGKCEGRGQ